MVLPYVTECGTSSEMTTSTKNSVVWLLNRSSKMHCCCWLQHTCLSCQRKGTPSTWVRMPSIYILRFSAHSPFGAFVCWPEPFPTPGKGELHNPKLPSAMGGRCLPGHRNEWTAWPAQESSARLRNTAGQRECTQGVLLAPWLLTPRPQMAAGPQGVTGSWWQQHV